MPGAATAGSCDGGAFDGGGCRNIIGGGAEVSALAVVEGVTSGGVHVSSLVPGWSAVAQGRGRAHDLYSEIPWRKAGQGWPKDGRPRRGRARTAAEAVFPGPLLWSRQVGLSEVELGRLPVGLDTPIPGYPSPY
ncbi:hypothetical protein DM860_011562 [Cuscuta australis]|uniref:Uncharacterized protein n=1 Tax=Cuscuta australis TaxID=267555 RepID=A0A328D0U2_9ASTE|nr:hypothetical protein DM860_011562 [Cuscuta australis]